LDRGACKCLVRTNRPLPCRAYDCRKDKNIWLDFEKQIINPEILRPGWPTPTDVKDAKGDGS
jgi:hypothetical protein